MQKPCKDARTIITFANSLENPVDGKTQQKKNND